MKNNKYHLTVLLNESLDNLVVNPKGLYVDATFGCGGHSLFLLNRLHPEGRVLAFDQAQNAIENNYIYDRRFQLFNKNFIYIYNILKYLNVYEISGLLADIGISYPQVSVCNGGFSIRFNNELDMRMNNRAETDAKKLINNYSEEMLANIFLQYGELKNARKIAKRIIIYRKKTPIKTTFDLIHILKDERYKIGENKYFAQIFQSIRIEVNEEINALKYLLRSSSNLLKNKGRIILISYHSLEDRLVKYFFKDVKKNQKLSFRIREKKIILSKQKEIIINPRARSAKMRIAEKRK